MRTGRVHVLLHSDLFARTHSHALSLRVALTREQLRELRHACVGALVTQACGRGRKRMQGWQWGDAWGMGSGNGFKANQKCPRWSIGHPGLQGRKDGRVAAGRYQSVLVAVIRQVASDVTFDA